MPNITYGGPSSRSDVSTEFHIRDEGGKMHVLVKGVAVDVPDALAKELLSGSDRVKGHKFEAEAKPAAGPGNSGGGK